MLKIFLKNPFLQEVGATGSAVSRLTWQGRFNELDKILSSFLHEDSEILDVAVSTGVTSLDLYKNLRAADIKFQLSICDPWSKVYVSQTLLTSVRNEMGEFILHYFGPLVFAKDLRCIWTISKALGWICNYCCRNRAFGEQRWLLDPSVRSELGKNNLEWVTWDVFQGPLTKKFDLIRVMNLLNVRLFKEGEIIKCLSNIQSSLKENGIFLVGQTNDAGQTHAGFYRKWGRGFKEVHSVNGGCPFASTINKLGQ